MAKKTAVPHWWVYLARCADASLYCGVTTDLTRRFEEHNTSPKGARYTRSRRPVSLLWSKKLRSRSAALKREYAIKQLTRQSKEKLIAGHAAPENRRRNTSTALD